MEKTLGIIPNATTRTGLLSLKTFNLIVTDERIICALLTAELIKAQKKGSGGILKQILSSVTARFEVYKRYQTMSPAQILAESKDNYPLTPVSLKLKESFRFDGDEDTAGNEVPNKLEIDYGKKITFDFLYSSLSFKEAKDLLEKAFPNKVAVK